MPPDSPPSSPSGSWSSGSNAPDGPEGRLAALGLVLPAPARPVAAYVPCRRVGNLLWISGQIPLRDGKPAYPGRVPEPVSIDDARAACRLCVLNALAAAKAELGSLDRVASVVRVGAWIACREDFTQQPQVANGASELLVDVFGEAGRHARAAVGTNVLPLGVPVEVELLLEVRA